MSKKSVNILLVDDNPKFLASAAERAKLKGFNVFTAENGTAALAMAESLGRYHSFQSKYCDSTRVSSLPVMCKQGNAFLAKNSITQEKFHYFTNGVKRLVIELELEDITIFLVHLALGFNPSHLEIIDPVIEGSVRARQQRRCRGANHAGADHHDIEIRRALVHSDSPRASFGTRPRKPMDFSASWRRRPGTKACAISPASRPSEAARVGLA